MTSTGLKLNSTLSSTLGSPFKSTALAATLAISVLTAALPSSARADFQPFQGSATWNLDHMLPDHAQWSSMYDDARDIANDLNSGGYKYRLDYKKKGGSSLQTLVVRVADNRVMGIWSAPNHATYIEGEIFAFQIARLFERSSYVTPGVRMTLTGPGVQAAYRASTPAETVPNARLCNQAHIVSYMQANPYYITGVYKAFVEGTKPADIPELVDLKQQKRLNADHFLVAMTNNRNAQPRNFPVYLNSDSTVSYQPKRGTTLLGRSTDTLAAKQISFMSLVDALNSQRDRFGPYGSNMQAMLDKNTQTFTIAAVDNGGLADSPNTNSLKYFLDSTSRFERDVAQRVLDLDAFIKGRSATFLQFRSISELKAAMGIESELNQDSPFRAIQSPVCKESYPQLYYAYGKRIDLRWKNFVTALDQVAKKVSSVSNDPNAYYNY